MKRSLISAVVISSAAFTSLATHATGQVVLNGFQNTGFDFDYGSFAGGITQNPTFVSIVATTDEGGAGSGVAADLSSFAASGQVQIEARLGSGHAATHFNIILASTPGVDFNLYQFPTSGLNSISFTTLTANFNAPLVTSGTVNWSAITQFQIQGGYNSGAAFSVDFANLQAIPEPSSSAFLVGGLVLLTGLTRRKHLRKPATIQALASAAR